MNRSFVLAGALVLTLSAACAQQTADINRVHPNVLRKSDIQSGTWYLRNTVIATPHNTQFTFPGQMGSLEKLVWEVQEHHLVGYRSYPFILGADGNIDATSQATRITATYCDSRGICVGGNRFYGAPIVAFEIKSHFDIQRGYNAATGEPTNVIAENVSDRPWNEREFIRVDWASNRINKNSGLNWSTVQNPAGSASASSWVQSGDEANGRDDWPNFEYEDRDGDGREELTYFDITARHLIRPDTTKIDGYGEVPMCFLSESLSDCTAAEVRIRMSVSRIDEQRAQDYEPLVFDNESMAQFGVFRTERLNFDRKFGFTESSVIRLGQRHRIWEHSYKHDATGRVTDEPIALAERSLKPIVYYFSPVERMGGIERYNEFWSVGRSLESEFDRAFRWAVAAAQQKAPSEVPQMFYLCNNPVKSTDAPACGSEGFAPRLGDLRFNFINTVAGPLGDSPLGYGPSSADPETGEIISGVANIYGWGVERYARQVLDWVLLLTGDRSIDDHISGQYVATFIKQKQTLDGAAAATTSSSLQAEHSLVTPNDRESLGAWSRPSARLIDLFSKQAARASPFEQGGSSLYSAATLLSTRPELEAAIVDNPDVQADLPGLASTRERARATLTGSDASHARLKARVDWLSKNSITTFDFVDRTLYHVAAQKKLYRDRRVASLMREGDTRCVSPRQCTSDEAKRIADDEIVQQVRQQIWLGLALHEAGHTVNLRHNFQGSFDALNFFDAFWDAKKETITLEQDGEKRLPRTPADFKKASDGTETARLMGIHDHEYSSIMDYSAKMFGNWAGLGKYDEAAILFAYSGSIEPGFVEVFEGGRATSERFRGTDGAMMTVSGVASDLPLTNAQHAHPGVKNYTERFHYSTVPLHFGEGNEIASVIDDGVQKMRRRTLANWSDVRAEEGRIRAALTADPTLADDSTRLAAAVKPKFLRVPYMFCSDESADGPVLSCSRFDRGADYYEIVQSRIEDYWAYYVDTHFRRDRSFFNGGRALNTAYSTFTAIGDAYRHWVYETFVEATRNQEQRPAIRVDAMLQDSWTMAVLDGINNHLAIMAVPPDGLLMYRDAGRGPRWDVISTGDDFDSLSDQGIAQFIAAYTDGLNPPPEDFVVVPRGIGRRMYSRYDYKSGYGYFNRMVEAGHYNDQIGAMFAAVTSSLDLQGVDFDADSRRYDIPYVLVFREELQRVFSALWSRDEAKIRPTLYKSLDASGRVQNSPVLVHHTFARGEDLISGFQYPAEVQLRTCGDGEFPPQCLRADQHAAPVNIDLSYTSRVYGLFLGMAFFRSQGDLDYVNANQIFKVGSGEEFQVASGHHVVSVTDPSTGQTYAAIERDGAPKDSTSAVRMLNIAKDHAAMANDPATCPLPENILLSGYTCMSAASVGNPAVVDARRVYWIEEFQNVLRDLELQRGMAQLYGKAFD